MKTLSLLLLGCIFLACSGRNAREPVTYSPPAPVFETPAEAAIPEGLPAVREFPGRDYEKVIAYELDGRTSIARAGTVFRRQTGKEVVLNESQVGAFLNLFNDPDSYGFYEMACFDPRIGLVFYDAGEAIVAYLSLCLACNNVRSEPALDLGLERISDSGFSKATYRNLLEMFNGWGIPHQHLNPLME